MINFFALFEAALAKKPYLKLEIGYGKITDWIVQVIDTTDEEDRLIVDACKSVCATCGFSVGGMQWMLNA